MPAVLKVLKPDILVQSEEVCSVPKEPVGEDCLLEEGTRMKM